MGQAGSSRGSCTAGSGGRRVSIAEGGTGLRQARRSVLGAVLEAHVADSTAVEANEPVQCSMVVKVDFNDSV
jgi:hypothetical protein